MIILYVYIYIYFMYISIYTRIWKLTLSLEADPYHISTTVHKFPTILDHNGPSSMFRMGISEDSKH